MDISAPELQESFAALTPELWELIPLVLDPGHCSSNGGGSQSLSMGPYDSIDGLVASVGTGLQDSARMDSREGSMALPRVPSTAAGTHVVAAAPSRAPPHGPWAGQQGRKRKKRNLYSWNQLHILESFFQREKYPSLPQAEMLSGMTGLTYQQIRTWFQNRRGKQRRLCSGNGTPGSSLSTLQTHFCADPSQDPFSLFDWSVNPVSSGPDPGMQWALRGPASSAFDSRIDLPPLQPAPCPTDFQGYNTWAPQPSVCTSPPAVTISSSFLHFSQVQSMESLEVAQLSNAGDSLISSFCMDSQWNPPCEPSHGAMPALVRYRE